MKLNWILCVAYDANVCNTIIQHISNLMATFKLKEHYRLYRSIKKLSAIIVCNNTYQISDNIINVLLV